MRRARCREANVVEEPGTGPASKKLQEIRMGNTLQVFNPQAQRGSDGVKSGRSLDSLQGKVVGFIDNAKPNFQYLVDDLADLLVAKYGVQAVVKHRKRGQVPVDEGALANLADKCDAVIAGSGD
jgi:hypothetical protein